MNKIVTFALATTKIIISSLLEWNFRGIYKKASCLMCHIGGSRSRQIHFPQRSFWL